jgi:hypothetical protein
MRTLFGFALSAVLLAALSYSFHQLVLRPASASSAAREAANDRLPTIPAITTAEPPPALPQSGCPTASDRLVLPAVPARPTPAELIAVLEHGTDDQAAAAIRELVATGDTALAPLTAFNARWRQALVTLTTAEAEVAATGEDVDLSASIHKAGRHVTRSATAIREISRKKAEMAARFLKADPPQIPPAAED